MLFVVPIGYYYGRDGILRVQNNMYNRLFSIKEEDLLRMKEIQSKYKEEEAIGEVEESSKDKELK
jgi:hypothetical protein